MAGAISTVAGKLRITLRSGVGCQISSTASQISKAKSNSVKQKVSGEYSNVHSVSGCSAAHSANSRAPNRASSMEPARSTPNTTSRKIGAVALYRCEMARWTPFKLAKVRRIKSSRDWVSTCTATSSGTRPPSIRPRTKSKSVCEADGKATSISLKPIRTSRSK